MVRSKIPSFFLKSLPYISILLISLFSYQLLNHLFYAFPAQGDTYDEYKAPFNGIGLLVHGVPESWSWYPAYGSFPTTNIDGGVFKIVKPWFDEPALFSLMIGSYSLARGITTNEDVTLPIYRHLMVYLGVFNVILLFTIIFKVHSLSLAIISSLIYASIPTVVLSQRLPISDNMVATFLLISLLLTVTYFQQKKTIYLILLAIFSSLSLHLKSTGVFIPVSIVAIFWATKRFRPSLIIIISTALSLILWFIYGYVYNWPLFLSIMSVSSGRELVSPTVIINLFQTFRIGEKTMGIDGWIIWGWISVIIFSFIKTPKHLLLSKKLLLFPLISYLIFFSIMTGHIKGWYRDPFFPLLAWASGLFILQMIKNPKIIPIFMFSLIPFASSFIYGHGGILWSNSQTKLFQIILVLFFTPFMFNEIFQHRKLRYLCQFLVIIIFALSIYYNRQTILQHQDFFYYFSL